jgi:hypothetical protein
MEPIGIKFNKLVDHRPECYNDYAWVGALFLGEFLCGIPLTQAIS